MLSLMQSVAMEELQQTGLSRTLRAGRTAQWPGLSQTLQQSSSFGLSVAELLKRPSLQPAELRSSNPSIELLSLLLDRTSSRVGLFPDTLFSQPNSSAIELLQTPSGRTFSGRTSMEAKLLTDC